jgi:hypothetical protein
MTRSSKPCIEVSVGNGCSSIGWSAGPYANFPVEISQHGVASVPSGHQWILRPAGQPARLLVIAKPYFLLLTAKSVAPDHPAARNRTIAAPASSSISAHCAFWSAAASASRRSALSPRATSAYSSGSSSRCGPSQVDRQKG